MIPRRTSLRDKLKIGVPKPSALQKAKPGKPKGTLAIKTITKRGANTKK